MTGSIWEVVGGADRGGILVREGQDVTSRKLAERLSTGALIEKLTLAGERLHFERLTGDGPNSGWVSIRVGGKDLVKPTSPGDDDAGTAIVPVDISAALTDSIPTEALRLLALAGNDVAHAKYREATQDMEAPVGPAAGAAVGPETPPPRAPTMFTAAALGNLAEIKKRLAAGDYVNAVDMTSSQPTFYTPVYAAALYGQLGALTLLLEARADPNVPNMFDKMTALHAAAFLGRANIVEHLLGSRAKPHPRDASGKTPLEMTESTELMTVLAASAQQVPDVNMFGIHKGRQEVRLLLEKSGQPKLAALRNGEQEHASLEAPQAIALDIWQAAQRGDVEEVKQCVAAGVDVNALERQFSASPLWVAATHGQVEALRCLLEAKADPNACGAKLLGQTAIHPAATFGREGVVELLLEARADPHPPDRFGRKPLDLTRVNEQQTMQAADWLQMTVDFREVQEGRQKIQLLFDNVGTSPGGANAAEQGTPWGRFPPKATEAEAPNPDAGKTDRCSIS